MSYLHQQSKRNGRPGSAASKADKEQELLQQALAALLKQEDNKYCADCEAKSPRWASWNIGVFVCIRCAGIHRKLGVHISKVKSVNLDSWTLDQVASVAAMGNTLAREAYEANLPGGFRRPNSDAGMEQFIRAKYEDRRYLMANFKPPRPDTASVYSLVKSPAAPSQQTAPAAVGLGSIPRPPPAATAAVSSGSASAAAPVPVQAAAKPPPPPAPPQPPQDLLLIGDEDLPSSAPQSGSKSAASPDSDFGSFIVAPAANGVSDKPQPAAQPRVNPDLILDDAGGWPAAAPDASPAAAVQAPKLSTKESIMALYGSQPAMLQNQQQQHLQVSAASGMHHSASSPMLSARQPAMYPQQQQQFYQQQSGLYNQAAGTLLYSSSQQQQPQQQYYQYGANFPVYQHQQQQHQLPPNQQFYWPATKTQPDYLQQVQGQMASMGLAAKKQPQQQPQPTDGGFPADIWN